MSPAALVGRALLVAIAQAIAETALLALLGTGLADPIAIENAALLLGAASVLGGAWAARTHLRGGSGAPLAAAVVPFAACAIFVAPRVWIGPAAPALATVAVVALGAPLIERAWARFVLRSPIGPIASRSALAFGCPLLAIGCAAGSVLEQPLIAAIAAVVAITIGAIAHTRAAAAEREVRLLTDYVSRVEVSADAAPRPPMAPQLRDPQARAIVRQLELSLEGLALTVRTDARARDQIADARQLRTRFMAAMSHELKSPLNSIVGFASLLDRGLEGDLTTEQRESVSMIRRSAEELILLLTDILDLARLEAGKLHLNRRWTPSVEILTEAVGHARTIVAGRDVEIEAELQPGLPPVFVDKARIVQAVVALFRNAASAMKRTRVRLRARIVQGPPGPARQLRIEIFDIVGAIGRENVERIFEAFQEITEPTGRRVGGLGMALTLARGLVRLHGGDAWAEPLPTGTVLCVAIPLEEVATPGRGP